MSTNNTFDFEFVEKELVEIKLTTIDVMPDSSTGARSLNELTDVDIENLGSEEQFLKYNPTTQKWENVSLETIIAENSIYNESPTKLTAKKFRTAYSYKTGTLRVFFNGIKEKLITEDASNEFSLPIDSEETDTIEVEYVKN